MEQIGVERSTYYSLGWTRHTSAVDHFCVTGHPHFLYIILNRLATNPTVFCFKSMEGGEPLVEPYPFLMDLLQRAGALHHVQNFVSARITTLVDFKAVEKTDLIALGIVELGRGRICHCRQGQSASSCKNRRNCVFHGQDRCCR